MLKLLSISFVLLLLCQCFTLSIYEYNFPKIEGGVQSMATFQGKKVMIITLPVDSTAEADSFLYSLDTLAASRIQSLAVVAVPAYEDGFTPVKLEGLRSWLRSRLGNYVVISDGLYTRKESGAQQHPLFQWLTCQSKNENFDIDVEGPGSKFFISNSGELYGVLRPGSKIGGRSVQKTLQIQ